MAVLNDHHRGHFALILGRDLAVPKPERNLYHVQTWSSITMHSSSMSSISRTGSSTSWTWTQLAPPSVNLQRGRCNFLAVQN